MTEDMTPTHDARYFDELLAKLREIRNSNRRSGQKVADILALTADYDGDNTVNYFAPIVQVLNELSLMNRFANMLQMDAESYAKSRIEFKVKTVGESAKEFINHNYMYSDVFNYQCFDGESEEDEDDEFESVLFPEELKTINVKYIVLKISNMNYFVNVFSGLDSRYRRAYEILADLDKEVIGSWEYKSFPYISLIPYKDEGDAIFKFSHFEVDMSEPDAVYRTLYVVYTFDTTVS